MLLCLWQLVLIIKFLEKMTTKIHTEILTKILMNSIRPHSAMELHSLLLVNWYCVSYCTSTLGNTFKSFWFNKRSEEKKHYVFELFLSCMDAQAWTKLIQNRFDLFLKPHWATFDYQSFACKLFYNNLSQLTSIYLQSLSFDHDEYNFTIAENVLFLEIYKLLINHC